MINKYMKIYKCKICGKEFNNRNALGGHTTGHDLKNTIHRYTPNMIKFQENRKEQHHIYVENLNSVLRNVQRVILIKIGFMLKEKLSLLNVKYVE